jgi:sulfate adenylyltransferase subunit 1 (EFTu-like GTPase family)
VQQVLRAADGFRGYAGQIVSGRIDAGDGVTVWPTGRFARVARIVTWDGDLDSAAAPRSVALEFDRDIDVGTGDVIATEPPSVARQLDVDLVWMDEQPLVPRRDYWLQHAGRLVKARANRSAALNEIARVKITTSEPLAVDRYASHRRTGSLLLIDPDTHFTAGAGMVRSAVDLKTDAALRGIEPTPLRVSVGAARRLAQAARAAETELSATEAVEAILSELWL